MAGPVCPDPRSSPHRAPLTAAAAAQDARPIATRTAGLQRADGFIPFYWDAAEGASVVRSVPVRHGRPVFRLDGRQPGSVELGMDRGVDAQKVVHFQRIGPRVLVVEQNLAYRALNGSARAQRERARLVLRRPFSHRWRSKLRRASASLWMRHRSSSRDAVGTEAALRQSQQGAFRLDAVRSSIYPARTKAFRRTRKSRAILTFAERQPGRARPQRHARADSCSRCVSIIRSSRRPPGTCPVPPTRESAIRRFASAICQRRSTRTPRCSGFAAGASRRRIHLAALSEPKQQIVFYVDPAIPEPIRSAMKAGFERWNTAFEAAGFKNAVRAADPTPDMDPMDIRHSWLSGSIATSVASRAAAATAIHGPARSSEPRSEWIPRASGRSTTTGPPITRPTTRDCMLQSPLDEMLAAMQKAGARPAPPAQDLVLTRQMLLTLHETGHSSRIPAQLELEHERARFGDGVPDAARQGHAKGHSRSERGLPRGAGRIRHHHGALRLYGFAPEKEKDGLAAIVKEMRAKGLMFTASTDPRWNWYDDLAVTGRISASETMAARKIILSALRPVAVLRRTKSPPICATCGCGWAICIIAGRSTPR